MATVFARVVGVEDMHTRETDGGVATRAFGEAGPGAASVCLAQVNLVDNQIDNR